MSTEELEPQDEFAEEEYDEQYEAARRAAWSDPRTSNLVAALFVTTAVFLAASVALIIFVLSLRGAPRTEVERQVQVAEQATEASSQDPLEWARLAIAYANADRYSDALDAVGRGRAIADVPELYLAEGIAHHSASRYELALEALSRGAEASKRAHEERVAAAVDRGVRFIGPDQLTFDMLRAKAETLAELDRVDEALEVYEEALEIMPRMSSTQAEYGKLLESVGRTEDAEEAYRRALTNVPDYRPALDGLERLGVEP